MEDKPEEKEVEGEREGPGPVDGKATPAHRIRTYLFVT